MRSIVGGNSCYGLRIPTTWAATHTITITVADKATARWSATLSHTVLIVLDIDTAPVVAAAPNASATKATPSWSPCAASPTRPEEPSAGRRRWRMAHRSSSASRGPPEQGYIRSRHAIAYADNGESSPTVTVTDSWPDTSDSDQQRMASPTSLRRWESHISPELAEVRVILHACAISESWRPLKAINQSDAEHTTAGEGVTVKGGKVRRRPYVAARWCPCVYAG